MGKEDPRKFLILGCHRSGTTMMRLILDSHPNIHCFDEWKGYSALLSGDYSNTKSAELLGFKCPNWTISLLYSGLQQSIWNHSPIIFMLRDVRGCIASMLRLKTGNGNFFNGLQKKWPENPLCPLDELAEIKKLDHPEYRIAALYWRQHAECYIEMARRGWPILPIHYEQFVQFPESHMRLICNFLQTPWDESLMKHYQINHDETPNGKAVGDTALDRPVDATSVLLWEGVFTPEQNLAILETAGVINDYVSILRGNKKEGGVPQY